MIASLADLLRTTLAHRQQQEVTLQEELELLEPYLEIERTRFGDRLTLEVQVPQSTLAAHVPHLVLQPLIENAIRHGIAPRRGPGWISIGAELQGEWLVLRVRDDGVGVEAEAAMESDGIGLSNIRDRLQQLYGGTASLRIARRSEGGTLVELRIPHRPAAGLAAVAV